MQWHQLVGSSDSVNFIGSKWSGGDPKLGEMEIAELDHLCNILTTHTDDPEHCLFGLCLIRGWVENALSLEESKLPWLRLPEGRDHIVLSGPLSAVGQIGDASSSVISSRPRSDPPPDSCESHIADLLWRYAPNLIWPSDRKWLVVSEVDFDSTLVAGSRRLVDALLTDGELEVFEVVPDTSLAAFSDKVNWVPGPED
jgi:hypothetical protein